jgi:multidrug resistance efflux pump
VLCFLLSAAAVGWLWQRQTQLPQTVGLVETVRLDVTAEADGVLSPLTHSPWTLFDVVEAQQVVAQLDDRLVQAQLATLQQELQRLQKDLTAAAARLAVSEADRRRSHTAESARLLGDLEQRRLAVLDRQIQQACDRLELQRREARLNGLQVLVAKNMVPDLQVTEEQLQRDLIAQRLEDGRQGLREAETQQQAAAARLDQYAALQPVEADAVLAPLSAAVQVQEARIRELDLQIERLIITAPIRGTICAIHHWPGERIRAGDPILTIAPDQGRYIISYVRPEQRLHPAPGMAAQIRVRTPGSPPLATRVERVGPQVEPIPLQHCRDPRVPEWGLPVRLALPAELQVRPGELVDIRFETRRDRKG